MGKVGHKLQWKLPQSKIPLIKKLIFCPNDSVTLRVYCIEQKTWLDSAWPWRKESLGSYITFSKADVRAPAHQVGHTLARLRMRR